MRVTRRFWAVAGAATAAAVLAVLLQSPLLFGATAGLAGWLVARQVAFARTASAVREHTRVRQSVAPNPVLVDDVAEVAVHLDRSSAPTPAATLHLAENPGLVYSGDPETDLTDGVETATLTVTASVPVVGEYTIDAPTVVLTDDAGLFADSVAIGREVTVTVQPRVPRDVHVGAGGERATIAHGEHDADRGTGGFEPGELHEYTPGDPANRIDWKATARLGDAYVREFESETSRRTVVLVDDRASMRDGPPGETKLDYARETALWLVEYAAANNDPLGVTFVRDDGAWNSGRPTTDPTGYRRLRQRVRDLTPEARGGRASPAWATTGSAAHERAAELGADDDFARTLRPFYEDASSYYRRVSESPLFDAAKRDAAAVEGATWVAVVTDDEHREELLETVRMVAGEETHVAAFVLPSALFDDRGLPDVDEAYDDYVAFEEFRRRLTDVPNVTAFEVGPRDRLDAVLRAQDPRRARR